MQTTHRKTVVLLFIMVLALFQLCGREAQAYSSYYTANCTSCHAAATATTCNGCHHHGPVSLQGTTDKTSYAPGEAISVTISGGSRSGWVRVSLYDQDRKLVAISNGNQSGKGHATTLPAVLSAPAPLTPGDYTWQAAWFGNSFDTGNKTASGHGEVSVSTNTFTVIDAVDNAAPVIETFILPPTANSLTVPVNALTATDDVAVTGYLVTESADFPFADQVSLSGVPTAYPVQQPVAPGVATDVTLYAYARDAAGNVSYAATATVTITTATDLSPLSNDESFARQVYRDFLNREPEADGLLFWTGVLTGGQMSRAEMVEQFLNSEEFGQTIAPVVRLYFTYFSRLPDYGGLMYWVNNFAAGMNLEEISGQFAASQEFIDRYGSLSNEEFVSEMYLNVYLRAADQGGLSYWTALLDNGELTRGEVMVFFSTADEYLQLSANQVYVTMSYIGLLRRAPELGGFNFWVDLMDQGYGGLDLIDGFLASNEYANRFEPQNDADGDGYTADQGDCAPFDASIHPGAEDICGDDIDQDCSGADLACSAGPDADDDGYTVAQGDCDDQDGTVYPGAAEICDDSIDQDCSGADLACSAGPDADGDGYTIDQGDCNDQDSAVHPGAEEVCQDGIDQNCDGAVDEDCAAGPPTAGHEGLAYSGPGTCLECHSVEAGDMFASTHYQWQGDALYMTDGPIRQGKIAGAVNTYCGNVTGNWGGCSACHVGRGLPPEETLSQSQLENIDCLVCHQKNYKRVKVNGVMVPDTANMTISMDRAVQTVHLPERANCLGCHARAGGGDAVKRGDLALATIATTDRDYDVHMSTTGADLVCQDCHAAQNHRFPGKGSDLRPTDLDVQVECSGCHGKAPHDSARLNRHTDRVACQTCHIPIFAKDAGDSTANEATEVNRSWQSGSEHAAPPLHPVLTKANNIVPVYRFWNRYSTNYLLGDVARLDPATGAYATSRPQGDVNDGKLYPFKYKTSDYPLRTASQELIALDTSVFFATADADAAAKAGLVNMGYSADDPYEWVTTDTFQLLNHQVSPEGQALQCADCHLNSGRMDLQGKLGYAPRRPQSTCASACHGSSKASEWQFGNWSDFREYHNKHINEKGATCADCHSFSR